MIEPDNGLRQLEFKKNQYGPLGASVALKYNNGLFLPEVGLSSAEIIARQMLAQQIFMDLLLRFATEGRNASHLKTSNNYAPTAFAEETEAKRYGLRKDDFREAMRELFAGGRIVAEPYGRPSQPSFRLMVKTLARGASS